MMMMMMKENVRETGQRSRCNYSRIARRRRNQICLIFERVQLGLYAYKYLQVYQLDGYRAHRRANALV